MRRRDFIAGLGASAWPVAAGAQPAERVRRIGVLMVGDSPVTQTRFSSFRMPLEALGWFEGRNLRIDFHHGSADQVSVSAAELVRLAPEVIFSTPSGLSSLWQMTRTIPVVFALATDPVADGFIESLARPGGNFTGLAGWDPSNSTKLMQLLKEIAPHVARVTYIYESVVPGMTSFVDAAVAVARSLGVEVEGAAVRDGADIERAIATLAQEPNGALFVASNPVVFENLDLIVALAKRHRLPTMGAYRFVPAGGGVIFWGSDDIDQCRRAASYVDRILKGEKPADLPVQAPTKFELVINLNTAKTLGPLGLEVATYEIRRADDIAPAFEALKGSAEALYVSSDQLTNTHQVRINTLALGRATADGFWSS